MIKNTSVNLAFSTQVFPFSFSAYQSSHVTLFHTLHTLLPSSFSYPPSFFFPFAFSPLLPFSLPFQVPYSIEDVRLDILRASCSGVLEKSTLKI